MINENQNVGEVKLNSVIQGDCLDVMKLLADKSIDMVLCDLPYG
jgi:DNA modification methylase